VEGRGTEREQEGKRKRERKDTFFYLVPLFLLLNFFFLMSYVAIPGNVL